MQKFSVCFAVYRDKFTAVSTATLQQKSGGKKGAITAVKYRLPSCRGNPSVYRMHVLFDKIKQTKRALSTDR